MSSLQDMNFSVRREDDRGETDREWLWSFHSFSFGDYIDPDHMGFRNLRVINETHLVGDRGLDEVEHRSMEIFTYVVKGTLVYDDSLGNSSRIRGGELQYLGAGSGVTYGQKNGSLSDPVHFVQFWLEPKGLGGKPVCGKVDLRGAEEVDGLCLAASPCGQDGALKIEQDAEIYIGRLSEGAYLSIGMDEQRPHLWLQMIEGDLSAGDTILRSGDGFSCSACQTLRLEAISDAHFLLFRLK